MLSNQYIVFCYSEQFIVNFTLCFLQFSFGLICMALLVLKNECYLLACVASVSLEQRTGFLAFCRREKWGESPVRDHFTVVYSVTWPLCGSEAGSDLALILTSLLLSCICA